MMDRSEIGRRIAFLRKRRGLTARELAERIGVSQGQISRLENGRQGLRSQTLIRLAGALGVEPYELLLPANAEEKTGSQPVVSSTLREALRDAEFVAVVEDIATAYRESPDKFRAIESVIRIVLGPMP